MGMDSFIGIHVQKSLFEVCFDVEKTDKDFFCTKYVNEKKNWDDKLHPKDFSRVFK